ncbi:MAG: hypothetical protein K2N98_01620 [Lachnospiraceae bacterium]|nr:hypothetical protein [Lachnospiraceae bacterium]
MERRREDIMRQAWKRCCEAAVLLGCLALFVGYGKGGAKVAPLIGADIRVAGFSGGRNDRPWNRNRQYGIYIMTVKVNKEEKAAVAEVNAAVEQRQYEEQIQKEVMQENEERFYEAADRMELNETEAAAYYQTLCRDAVFQNGVMRLTGLAIYDIDQNGQEDMAAMVEDTTRNDLSAIYGTGRIYFYMNGEEPCCFTDEDFPFHYGLDLFSADIDNDGNMELVFEARGTGNGGSGDWHCRILKYKDHTMTKMELPTEYEGETELNVQVTQEMQKDTYSAYCPYFDETIVFHAQNVFEPYEQDVFETHGGRGGANCRGFYDLKCVEYENGSALEVSEYLYGEGGIAHGVGIAKFIIVWDEDGNSRADKWWVEPWE